MQWLAEKINLNNFSLPVQDTQTILASCQTKSRNSVLRIGSTPLCSYIFIVSCEHVQLHVTKLIYIVNKKQSKDCTKL